MLFTIAALCAVRPSPSEASAQAVSVDRKQVSNAAARKMWMLVCPLPGEEQHPVGVRGGWAWTAVLLDFHAMQGGGPTLSETAILKAKDAAHGSASDQNPWNRNVTSQRNQASVWITRFSQAGALPILIGRPGGRVRSVSAARASRTECAQAGSRRRAAETDAGGATLS